MKKMLLICGMISLLALTGCSRQITGSEESDQALQSFNTMVKDNKDMKSFHHSMGHWGLTMKDGNKFEWVKDTALTKADFAIVIQTKPFVDAGVKPDDLKDPYIFKPEASEAGMTVPDLILLTHNLSDKKETAQGSADAMRRLLKQNNQLAKKDSDAGVFRLNMENGVQVSWTDKEQSTDAVLTFYIPLEPLEKSGLVRDQILAEGWMLRPAGQDVLGSYPDQIYKEYQLQ